MESLKDYDSKAQEYIINMGLFMYGKSKDFFMLVIFREKHPAKSVSLNFR